MQLKIHSTFDAAHRLAFHKGLCRNLHGHRYDVDIILEGVVGDNGILVDFGILKRDFIRPCLADLDHALLLEQPDPLLTAIQSVLPEQRVVLFRCPPTAEAIAALIFSRLHFLLPSETTEDHPIHVVSVEVHETADCSAILSGSSLCPDFLPVGRT